MTQEFIPQGIVSRFAQSSPYSVRLSVGTVPEIGPAPPEQTIKIIRCRPDSSQPWTYIPARSNYRYAGTNNLGTESDLWEASADLSNAGALTVTERVVQTLYNNRQCTWGQVQETQTSSDLIVTTFDLPSSSAIFRRSFALQYGGLNPETQGTVTRRIDGNPTITLLHEAWTRPGLSISLENSLWAGELVDRIAADGETEVILVVKSRTAAPVTLQTLTPANASFRTLIGLADGPVTLSPGPDPNFPFEARRSFIVAEPFWAGPNPIQAQVRGTQGAITATVDFSLQSPPLVALHGIWAGAKTWSQLYRVGLFLPLADITIIDYERYNYLNFAGPEIQGAVRDQLAASRQRLSTNGFAFTRFNAVGHSMGAVIARTMPNQGSSYYRDDNRGLGDLRYLVSVGAPMQGSPLPRELADRAFQTLQVPPIQIFLELLCAADASACPRSTPSIVAGLMVPLKKRITCGPPGSVCAVNALSPNSNELNELAAPSVLPYDGIRGIAPDNSTEETLLSVVVKVITLDLFSSIDSLFAAEGDPRHDTIVGYLSQNAGAATNSNVQGVLHAAFLPGSDTADETNSSAVFSKVACLLRATAACAAPLVAKNSDPNAIKAANDAILNAFLAHDISTWTDVSQAGVNTTFTLASPLTGGMPVLLNIVAASGTIDRAYFQVDGGPLQLDVGPVVSIDVVPRTPSVRVSGIVLLSGNRFARFRAESTVIAPTSTPFELRTLPAPIRLSSVAAGDIQVKAFYLLTDVDVTENVTMTWLSAGTPVISLSGRIVTPLRVGSGTVRFAFGGATVDVPVSVYDGSAVFANGFEGQ